MDIAKSKRPEWAAAGTFAEAWRAAAAISETSSVEWHRSHGANAVAGLAAAHVITLERRQVEALPKPWDSYLAAARMFRDVRLPFDPVYLSLERTRLSRFTPPARLVGALVGTPRFLAHPTPERWDGRQPMIIPFYDLPDFGVVTDSCCWATGEGWAGWDLCDQMDELPGLTAEQNADTRSMKGDAAAEVASVLYFLESANVELVEGAPSRQERREVERRGGRIAFTVLIRPPKKRPRADGPADHPDWSHRWEVRGHYKHFPVGTRIADAKPEKLAMHPTLGQCRRIWCPPHVKGPQDKPLVPKIRTLAPVTQAPAVSDSRV